MWSNNKCQCEVKDTTKHHVCEKYYTWNPSKCICEIDKYSKSNTGELVNTCDKIIEPTKTGVINSNNKKATFKLHNFYVLLTFINYY